MKSPESVEKLLDLTKDSYQKIAQDFNISRKKAIWPEITRVVETVKDGERILDVGCGNGRLLEALKDKKIDYLGVDNSEEMIKLARQNYPERQFLTVDILDLSAVLNQSFDQIFCLAVLHHLPGREVQAMALKQLAAKLRSGGRIIISVWNLWRSPKHRRLLFKSFWSKILRKGKKGDWRDLIFSWKNARGQEMSPRYYHAFTGRELRKISTAAGLRVKKRFGDKYNYWLIIE